MKSVVCYLWRGAREFHPDYVDALARMVAHHLPEPHRFICVTDRDPRRFSSAVEVLPMPPAALRLAQLRTPEGEKFPSSYPRLWTLSAEAAQILGEWVLLLDVDCMVVSDLRPLFRLSADFVGWNVRPPPGGPKRFGGGTWLHRTGTRTHVYEDFVKDPAAAIACARAAGYRGSDQAWISYCLASREPCWPEPSGIFCAQDYRKAARIEAPRNRHGRRRRVPGPARVPPAVPPGAIILHMNGVQKPWNSHDEIVTAHWRPFYSGNRC